VLEFLTHPLTPDPPAPPPRHNPWRPVGQDLARQLVVPGVGAPRYLESLLDAAVRLRASDVHLLGAALDDETGAHLSVRFRIDGQLHRVADLYGADARRVLSRAKVFARMDLGRPKPQEGCLAHDPRNPNLRIRATAMPTPDGEHVALRLFARELERRTLGEIGLPDDERARLDAAFDGEGGLVLATGPAGAGKSTTLHAILEWPF